MLCDFYSKTVQNANCYLFKINAHLIWWCVCVFGCLCLSGDCYSSLFLSLSHFAHSHTHAHTLFLMHTLSHTHTHTLTPLRLSCTRACALSHTRVRARSLSLSLSCRGQNWQSGLTQYLQDLNTHTHTHTHTHKLWSNHMAAILPLRFLLNNKISLHVVLSSVSRHECDSALVSYS